MSQACYQSSLDLASIAKNRDQSLQAVKVSHYTPFIDQAKCMLLGRGMTLSWYGWESTDGAFSRGFKKK